MADVTLLDKRAAERPIDLPDHPYVRALKDFGADEILAGFIDAFATTLVNIFIHGPLKLLILPFCGPVIEKLGFFPLHFKKAYDIWKTTPEEHRKPLKQYFKQGIKDGAGNLLKDLLVHDPLYIGFMAAGLAFTSIHPGILSAFSYTTAILLVAAIDVTKDELLYRRLKRSLFAAGFQLEPFYESRFLIRADYDREKLIRAFAKEFNVTERQQITYHDQYFETTIPTYSGRRAKLRLRSRDRAVKNLVYGDTVDFINSAQIVYTRADEQKDTVDQCRYFPVKKEKLYVMLEEKTLESEKLSEGPAQRVFKRYAREKGKTIRFTRTYVHNDELALCVDKVEAGKPFYVVELKTRKDKKLLQRAMRFLMIECPVVQTTHGKSDLVA